MVDTSGPFPFTDLYHNTTASNRSKIIQGVRLAKWKKNEHAPRCGICIKSFGFLRRKHHCRVCGDICCRRCLGFCVVDVPYVGVDISYTCLRCIRHHNKKPTLVEDLASLAQSFDNAQLHNRYGIPHRSNRPRSKTSEEPTSMISSPMNSSGYSSNASTPRSLDAGLLPSESQSTCEQLEYQVIVSQYHRQKLHSVCSLLGDYLECKGGAIVLMQQTHVWVLAHRGLRPTALHSSTFLSICHQAMQSKESFTASRDGTSQSPSTIKASHHQPFRFFGVSPIFQTNKSFAPIGCILALDTKPRNDTTAKQVQKTLDNLSRLVINVLAEDETILRLFESGEFKDYASSSHDDSKHSSNPTFGITSPTSCSSSPEVASAPTTPQKTRNGDRSFFARYANTNAVSTETNDLTPTPRKHAQSDPEPKQPFPSTSSERIPSFRQAA